MTAEKAVQVLLVGVVGGLAICQLLAASVVMGQEAAGSIEGTVKTPGSGMGLAGATVTLREVGAGEGKLERATISDAAGRFRFVDVPTGRYEVRPVEPRYDRMGGGRTVTVSAGVPGGQLTLWMATYARVSGTVIDSDAQPVAGALVRPANIQILDGRQVVAIDYSDEAVTDESGEYALTLPPGRYYIVVADEGREGEFPVHYYPAALLVDEAVLVTVSDGVDLGGLNVRLSDTELTRLQFDSSIPASIADVVAVDGAPIEAYMRMSGPGLGRREVERHVLVAVGENRYQSGPLSPGEYDILLRYRFVQGIRGSGRDLSSVDPIAVLRVSIDPDREDAVIDLGEVSLVAYQDVSGQISARSSRGELLELGAAGEALRVQVMQQVGVLRTAEIGGNGSVLFRRVPSGTYRLVIQGVPSGWYVASATGGGRDVLNHGLVVGGQAGPVTISLSAGALDVQGVARREDGAPAADVRVLLIPPVHLRGEFTRYPTAVTDQTGAWIIRDVAPGEYRAIAVDPQGRQEGTTSFYNYWEAPEFLRRAEGLGDLIRLASGSAPPLQLSLEIVPTGDW